MRSLVAFLMLATASLTLAAQDDPVREVMSVPAGIGPAMRGKDTAALEKIWSPQMKVNSPGNTIRDRSTVLKLLSQGSIKYSAFKDVVEDFAPGAVALWHSHPGEELVYVPQGELEFQFDGEKPVTLRTGDVLFVPSGEVHMARNLGSTPGVELATDIVEKGKRLLVRAADSQNPPEK